MISRMFKKIISPPHVRHLSSSASPLIELREYALKSDQVANYVKATTVAADLRKSLVPLRLFSLPDSGGQLNVASHLYFYAGGHAQRDKARARAAGDKEWLAYLDEARLCMLTQRSLLFVEAPLVSEFPEIIGMEKASISDDTSSNPIYEVRRYQLRLGYDVVPNFLDEFARGLPSKLAAKGSDPSTALVTVLYTEVGNLNEVIEIWRHGGGTQSMETSRKAARGASDWRSAIKNIADLATTFSSTIHRPLAFSPFK